MAIAIIGAGLAGVCAARALVAAGRTVVLVEKSRGLGGRVATRRGDAGRFDHGAPLLQGLPEDLTRDAGGAVAAWRDGHVGLPGNSGFVRALAGGLALRAETRATGMSVRSGGWRVALGPRDDAGPFAVVLLAVPQPQAVDLLGDHAGRFAGLDCVAMRPGWTLMAAFDAPVAGPDWRALAPPLAHGVREAAKPGREPGERWVVHAAPAFAAEALETDREAMAATLVAAFRDQTGAGPPAFAAAHRWCYAETAAALGRACLWDGAAGLGLAGDWCLGARAGDAAASGRALAAAVLEG